jgi:hypothetical protein
LSVKSPTVVLKARCSALRKRARALRYDLQSIDYSGRRLELTSLDHGPTRLQQNWLGPRTRFNGLWLIGQDVLTCGVTGAMMAGLLTTSSIIGMRKSGALVKKIFAAPAED